MTKKEVSLHFINKSLVISLFFIVTSVILTWSFYQTKKNIEKNQNSYFEQSLNMSKIIFEQEKRELNYMSDSLAKELNNFLKIENKKIDYLLNSSAVSEKVDLLFLRYKNKTKDYSYSLFNTKELINKINGKNLIYENNLISVNLDGKDYILILSQKNILDDATGRVKAKLILAKIINDDFSYINNIKNRTNMNGIIFKYKNNLISSTLLNKEHLNILNNDSVIISSRSISFEENKELEILFIMNNLMFNDLENDFFIYTLFILFISLSIILSLYFAANKIIVFPVEKLIKYSKKLRTDSNINYKSDIKEFNDLASSLKTTIVELKEVKEQYSQAIDGVEDGLWNYDLLNNKIYLSKRCKDILLYGEKDDISDIRFWIRSIHKDDKKIAIKKYQSHLDGKTNIYEDVYRLKCKTGVYKYIKIRGKAFFDKNNRAYKIMGFYTDVNEIKLLQKQNNQKEILLFQQSKLASMGEMIGNIAHQWRQPLSLISIISSSIQFCMQYEKFPQDDVYKDLEKINKTVEYLSLIIDKFSNFFNPNNELEEFYLKDMLNENIAILQSSFKVNEVNLILNIENTKIKAYKFELLQILLNLINNAKDALYENDIKNKLIFMNSYVKENNLYIEIFDNALGIPFEISSKIYEPYFTTKDQSQGTGIGLYMTLSIIEKHFNGSLLNGRFEFEYENKTYVGEKFIINFPLKIEKS